MKEYLKLVIVVIQLIYFVQCDHKNNEVEDPPLKCNLPKNLLQEIAGYAGTANKIIKSLTEGKHKGSTYNGLAEFIDKFGNRVSGSKNLENAIDYMLNKSVAYNLENVHGENVTVPHWVR